MTAGRGRALVDQEEEQEQHGEHKQYKHQHGDHGRAHGQGLVSFLFIKVAYSTLFNQVNL